MSLPTTTTDAKTADVTELGWDIDFQDDSGEKPWNELDAKGKVIRVVILLAKVAAIVGGLYMFIWCAHSVMPDEMRRMQTASCELVTRSCRLSDSVLARTVCSPSSLTGSASLLDARP